MGIATFDNDYNGRVIEDVPQNFQVAHTYRIGLNYKLFKRLTMHTGYGMENGVVGEVGNNNQATPVEVSGGEFKGIADLDADFVSFSLIQKF